MASDFSCQRCAGQSIVPPEDFADDAHITCRTCGALQGTLRDLRHVVGVAGKNHEIRSETVAFSGC